MPGPSKIVTPEKVEEMFTQLRVLKDVDHEIKLASLAGIDVAEVEAKAKAMKETLHGYTRVYAPGRVE
jgi:hypothetical protein